MGSSLASRNRRWPYYSGVDLDDMQDSLAVALVIQNVPGGLPRRIMELPLKG
jgi:hypothetical protein